ncbi:hypothetical protein J4208_05085 [Candidatus Woesearchaeota archaeon]|nr:hypothetical protein [Candidatus Woesearchaeota archaeon]
MRDNRSDRRGGSGFRGRSEGRDGFRGRSSGKRFEGDFEERGGFSERRGGGRFERRPMEMHDVVCAKCGKDCQVPFKPTSDKPVYCSDCFKSEGGRTERGGTGGAGISPEQFKQLNTKLDKILEILENITVEEEDEEEVDEESEEDKK